MKRMMLLFLIALASAQSFGMNVKSKAEPEQDRLIAAFTAMENMEQAQIQEARDIKAQAETENDGLTDERRAALEKMAANANSLDLRDYLDLAFDDYNMLEFNFWLSKGAVLSSFLKRRKLYSYIFHDSRNQDNHNLDKLKLLLKLGFDPNEKYGDLYDRKPALWTTVDYGNVEAAKILLADPRTILDQELSPDSYTLMMEAAGLCYHIDPSVSEEEGNCTHKKMVKLLLFMGCNATFKNGKGWTAEKKATRLDIVQMIKNHEKIKNYCTPEELDEFGHVMMLRKGGHSYLIKREIQGAKAKVAKKKIALTAAQVKSNSEQPAAGTMANVGSAGAASAAIKFEWPKIDGKDKN